MRLPAYLKCPQNSNFLLPFHIRMKARPPLTWKMYSDQLPGSNLHTGLSACGRLFPGPERGAGSRPGGALGLTRSPGPSGQRQDASVTLSLQNTRVGDSALWAAWVTAWARGRGSGVRPAAGSLGLSTLCGLGKPLGVSGSAFPYVGSLLDAFGAPEMTKGDLSKEKRDKD